MSTAQSPEVDAIFLAPGVKLTLSPEDEGVRVYVIEDDDAPIYSAVHDREFYSSPQKRRTIANEISRRVDEALESEAVAESFRDVCTELAAAHEEVADALRPPTVTKLIDQTTAVEFRHAGSDSFMRVHFTVDGREDAIEFTRREWISGGGIGTLQEQYATLFFPAEIDVTAEHWDLLKEHWRAIADELAETDGGDR
jgi:hypothetical protein